MNLEERARNYSKAFPDYPPLVVHGRWLYGVWMIGNYYQNASRLYGAYPHSYLKRILSLFPDKQRILHLFSGSLQPTLTGTRFDIREDANPDVLGDAHKLSEYFDAESFNLILADPPYSDEDAVHYGTSMTNRNVVVRECTMVLEENGFLVWLDQVFPMYHKTEIRPIGTIGLTRSTNHRVRMIFIFEKNEKEKHDGLEYRLPE